MMLGCTLRPYFPVPPPFLKAKSQQERVGADENPHPPPTVSFKELQLLHFHSYQKLLVMLFLPSGGLLRVWLQRFQGHRFKSPFKSKSMRQKKKQETTMLLNIDLRSNCPSDIGKSGFYQRQPNNPTGMSIVAGPN